jgi:hypothetical protein
VPGRQDYDPLRRPEAAVRLAKPQERPKNPFVRTLSMFEHRPLDEDVSKTLWGSTGQPPWARK